MSLMMRSPIFLRAIVSVLLLLVAPERAAHAVADHAGQPAPAEDFPSEEIEKVSNRLCGQRIVLLGENGFHGDGRTIAFKASLVRRLVLKCHFNAVMFESGIYDFLAVDRLVQSGQPVTTDAVSAAIGGIWNRDHEMAALVPFLADRMNIGRLRVGGLDDQLGARGALYANDQMLLDLTKDLPSSLRSDCRDALRRRVYYDFPPDAPYSPEARSKIEGCLQTMKSAIGSARYSSSAQRADFLQMIASIGRCISRDFDAQQDQVRGRDLSMYENFRWLIARLPRKSKVIVWAANEHVAKDARSSDAFGGGGSFGEYVHQDYGRSAYAVGFSAAGGAFRWSAREDRLIPAAAAGSLEAQGVATSDDDPIFLDLRARNGGGRMPGAFFGHRVITARWSDVFDGVVVFKSERPTLRTDAGR